MTPKTRTRRVLLEELETELEDLSKRLGKLNDAYPATRAFLEKKGVRSVNDLDKAGRAELRVHLEDTLKLLLAGKLTPSEA